MSHLIVVASDKIDYDTINKEQLLVKRIMDIGLSIVALPIALPLITLGGLAMKITSAGPMFFTQKRVGLKGKIFTIYKLRTMVHCEDGYLNHTVSNDSRITKVGLILRKTKIDELPQLFNVLIGDMSLVGPRPERKEIVEEFARKDISYNYRHTVRPGITGLAQVNNPLATPEENLEKLKDDLYYINNYSLKLEVRILLKTVGVVSNLQSL